MISRNNLRGNLWLTILALLGAIIIAGEQPAAASCESLASTALSHATITSSQIVPAGAFTPPTTQPNMAAFAALPAFCRVTATLMPSTDSDIRIEVWLPANGWNGKLQAVGNGGWAGVISYSALASAVAGGYAATSTD